jgi:NADPH:quinone reductase-like Zn-dependent oxidoreductase
MSLTASPPASASGQFRALWFLGPGNAAILPETFATRSGDGVCLVRSFYSAVSSGSERLVLAGRVPPDLHPAMRVPYMAGDFPFPVKYGYSLVGRVEQGPRDVLGRVVHLMHPHQDLCTVKAADVFPVPDDVPPARAPLASNLETAVTAVWDARPALGERVLVVGFGYIGALIGQLLRGMPGIDLHILEVEERRMQCALEMGYELAEPGGAEFDLAFHTSGSPAGLQEALDRVGMEGRVVEVSWYGTAETTLRLGGSFHSKRKTIIASQVSTLPAFQTPRWDRRRRKQLVFSLLRDPAFDRLLGDPIPFEQLPEFFNRPPAGRDAIAPLVVYQ